MVRSLSTLHYFFKRLDSSISSEFNYVKNSNDECVLVPGTTPIPDDESCKDGGEYWYERTRINLSLTRAVWTVTDVIVARLIVVLDVTLKDLCSGS